MPESNSGDDSNLSINSELGIYLTSNKDFTVYWPNGDEEVPRCLREDGSAVDQRTILIENESIILVPYQSQSSSQKTKPFGTKSFNNQIQLSGEYFPPPASVEGKPPAPIPEGRVCACSCYRNKYVSATVRTKTAPTAPRSPNSIGNWKCSVWGEPTENLIETVDLVEELWKVVFPNATPGFSPTGLVVFAGSTNAGKSALAQAFALETIRNRLSHQLEAKIMMPHLVSFEDPIEQWSVSTRLERLKGNETNKVHGCEVKLNQPDEVAKELKFYFTPRQKDTDVADLESALLDAKRQTPACFFIGEVRRPSDWQRVIEFAGSGHLVVTTTHAATLNETLSRILVATKAETPAQRRSVAGSIAAAVHIVPSPERIDGMKALLPAVWTRTGVSLNALVADGLSSVIPDRKSVYSRAQFVTHIGDSLVANNTLSMDANRKLLRVARHMDREDLELQ